MGHLLLIVMGETFFEVVLAYKTGMEAQLLAIALLIAMFGLTWALYFDSIWPAGRPWSSYALPALGIGQASVGLSQIAVRDEGNALVYALMVTFLGFWAFGLSTETLAGIDIEVQGAVVAALLLITVILSSRLSRNAAALAFHDFDDARPHVE